MPTANRDAGKALIAAGIKPTAPGAYLGKVFLPREGVSVQEAAQKMRIPFSTLNDVVSLKKPVTPEIAERLSGFTGLSVQFWLNMQAATDRASEPEPTPVFAA